MSQMRNVSMEEILTTTLNKLERCFDEKKGELAYLALTSKPEFVIRDRLAVELHKRLGPNYIVAREWKRIDLVILRKQKKPEPEALVQLKTWSLFTFVDDAEQHLGKVEADIDKCQNECPAYALILATHIDDRAPEVYYEGVVKYWGGWKRAFRKHKTAMEIENIATAGIGKELGRRKWIVVDNGKVLGGKAFGVTVSVLWWLIQMK